MSEPTTLGEVFEQPVENPYGDEVWERRESEAFDAGVDATKALFGRILYGSDEPCPECKSRGWTHEWEDADGIGTPCSTCHSTGRLKTPGLVERLNTALQNSVTRPRRAPLDVDRLFYALRREIGEKPG